MQIAHPRVVSEPFPGAQDFLWRGGGQRAHIGKSGQPAAIIIEHGGYLRLLQHELADEDGVRVTRTPPGEIAAGAGEPIDERRLEGAPILWFLEPRTRRRFN